MKQYGNSYWQEATDNKDKTVAIMSDDVFQNIYQNIENSGLNYCAYSDGNTAMVAVNSSELERFKEVAGLDDTLCQLRKSNKEHIPQDKNVIGNTEYRYIPNKTYISEDRETVLKMAEIANRENVPFSARIYADGNATMTISKADEERVNSIRDNVKTMRGPAVQQKAQPSREIIGNLNYRDIQNKHFFVSPLTPENYRKIEPLLMEKGVEFSGLIRNNNVMFTVENDKSQDFYNKLNEAIYESSMAEMSFEERYAEEIAEMTAFLSNNESIKDSASKNDYDEYLYTFDGEFVNHILMSDNEDFKNSFFDEFSEFKADFTNSIFGELKEKIFAETEKEPEKIELTETEKNFLDAEIEPVMAKSVLAWDEIEDLGYIFFEEGYIDRYSPSERAMYGNGVDEKDIYALADKMRNGEDVRADLTRALLGNQQTFSTKQDNTFHVTYNKDDITATFGNAEKSISYEAVGDAFLKLFEGEYKEIMAAREAERQAEEKTEDTVKEDSLTFSWGKDRDWFTESDILHEFAEKNPEISFALANAVFEYLDEKQHTERANPDLNAGWYKKTDFVLSGVLNGEDFNYEGRFDIGDGKSTGGGSIIDHISRFQMGIINSDRYPYDNSERKADAQEAMDTFIPFLEKHSQLTAKEMQILSDLKAEYPIRTEPEIEKAHGTFRIMQLNQSDEEPDKYHGIRFFSKEFNDNHGVQLNHEDYTQVYEGDLSNYPADRTLESIYERMNIGEKPDGYTGHSLSMSDVIVTNIDGEEKAYYCDDFGFTEMPEFFREKEIIAEKSPIVEEFRAKTEEMFHAVPTNYDDFNPSVDAIERAARNYIDFVLQENDLQDEITINDVIISGSRCRGLETDNSDLDIVIEYESDSYREDAFFNLLNDTEVNDNLHLGISVDYNPIRKEETGTLETYLPTVEAYLTEKANEKSIETLRDAVDKFFGTDCDKAVTDNGEWRLQIYDGTSENLMNKEIIGVAYHNDEPVCDIHNISVDSFKIISRNADGDRAAEEIAERMRERRPDQSIEAVKSASERTVDDIKPGDKYRFKNEDYTVTDQKGIYPDDIVIAKQERSYMRDHWVTFETTSNVDKFELHNKGVFLGNENDMSDNDLETAKNHINEFCQNEFGTDADFSDLSKVDLAYTTDEDNGLEIQVSADLEQYRMIFAYDGNTVREEQYESLADMNENALSVLDYGDLISLSEDEKAPVIAESIGVEDDFSDIDTQQIRKNLENTAPEESPFVQQVRADVDSIDDDAPLFADSIVYEEIEKAEKADTPSFENTYGEQMALFGFEDMSFDKPKKHREFKVPELKQADISGINTLDELKKEIQRGSGFENGKFRIQKFYEESKPNNKEFADFLKHEYGIGGHSANDSIAFVDHDSKGIQFTLNDENGKMSDTKFTFTWTEAAKMASDLIDKGEYLSEKQAEQYIEWKNPVKEDVTVDENVEEVEEFVGGIQEETVAEPETITADKSAPTEKADKGDNFVITDDSLGEGGAKTKFKNNLLAIETLKQIESENRTATLEEQEVMSKYVGWGGLASAFDPDNKSWATEYGQLKEIMTDKEYAEARSSVLDSFFTAPAVIDGIYEALEKFGFEGGNILEPSCGVGNFIGRMPSEMAENSNVYGVEVDTITGRIAQQLYPNADIQVTGFENTRFQNGAFDVAVGNVPFGELGFQDKEYGTTKLHDFFFAKTMDKVKDGGVVAFITSAGTLDKRDESTRQMLADKADLIGAIRLPGGKNGAFKDNAGTEVTTDIIFLQKHEGKSVAEMSDIPDWVHIGETAEGLPINKYFENNPDMVLGEVVDGNKLYGTGTMVVADDNFDLKTALSEAVSKLSAEISHEKPREVYQLNDKETAISADGLRPFSYFKDDKGDIFFKGGEDKLGRFDVKKVMDSKNKDYKRLSAFIDIRDTTRTLLKVQAENCPDETLKALQGKLTQQYDDFYAEYGLIHSKKNKSVLREDCSYNLLLTLEKEYDKDKLVAKSDIFTKRTIKPSKAAEHVDTALEALTISMAETARVDLDYMSKLTDMSPEKLISDLKGEIFLVPGTENTYQSASEYLSGDIRQKLDKAQAFAETDSRFAENVTALEKAMPEPLKAGDIEVKIGATWIDPKLYEQFLYETLGTPNENRADVQARFFWQKPKHIKVEYSEHTGQFHIENKRADQSVNSTREFGTRKMNAYEIMESLLNLKDPKIYKTVEVPDGMGDTKEKRVIDIEATKIAQQKATKLKNAFKEWIFKTPERAVPLVEQYNRQFNSVRPREYDGSALRFPGMNNSITLREHQKNAVAHALFGGNTLFAHVVGAGKTFEMIASVMESKRLGLCTKPLMAVPNHLTEQIGEDFQKLYPSANILIATKNDFKKENRQQLFAKIATGDFDAVIIGHSQLGMIPLSKERQEAILTDQINDIIAGIEELKKSEGSKFQVKQMERTKKSLEAKLEKLGKSHDDILTFEEMGVDKLVVDELHEFKNVPTVTKLTNVAGISSSASQKALDLFMKVRYLDEKTGGKGFIGATGTPISNSVTELHTMMRFLEYDFLKDHGLANFDNWVSVFGNQKSEWELASAGNRFKERTRIADYTGLPELMSMFKQVADVRTADTLNLPTPEMEYHIENVEATEFQKLLVQELSDRADDVQGGNIDPSIDNMLRITSDGRKLGLDPRLIDPSFEDDPNTKLNQCVRNVYQIYEDTAENKSTQIIFCDLGVPKKNSQNTEEKNDDEKSAAERESLEESGDFCVYDDIRDKLIAKGVKPEEIAYIHDAKTEQQKTDLFDKVNKGEVRVLLGSTAKMGTGTNCQKKLIALHNLDIPWRPSDMSQRGGRIERQGNENSKAHIYNYVTKGSFDAYLYQTLEAKQRFIGQIMTSKTPARRCEDVDQQALSYSEIKALCTGDERIKEKMMLENEVKELNLLKSEHTNTVFDMQQKVSVYPEKHEQLETALNNLRADREILRKLPIDAETKLPEFKITIDGTEYTDRKEAAKALEDTVMSFVKKSSDVSAEIGEFQGFKISVTAIMIGAQPDISITMENNAKHTCTLTSNFPANLKRMESTLYKIDQRIDDVRNKLSNLEADYKNAEKIVNSPFPQQEALDTKTERLSTLTDELNKAAAEAKKNKPKQERTCYFERAKLKREAFKDKPKSEQSKSAEKKKDNDLGL